jgi:hypothetical protein
MPFHEYNNHYQLVNAFAKGHGRSFTPRTETDTGKKALGLQVIDLVIQTVMNMCWVKSANQRPTAERVRSAVEGSGEIVEPLPHSDTNVTSELPEAQSVREHEDSQISPNGHVEGLSSPGGGPFMSLFEIISDDAQECNRWPT